MAESSNLSAVVEATAVATRPAPMAAEEFLGAAMNMFSKAFDGQTALQNIQRARDAVRLIQDLGEIADLPEQVANEVKTVRAQLVMALTTNLRDSFLRRR